MRSVIITRQDLSMFKEWIYLDYDSLTWKGKYTEEFDKFWDNFFSEDISLSQIGERFKFAMLHARIGPLSSWFEWLREKFICYAFIIKGLDLAEISIQFGINLSSCACIIRNFLVQKLPFLDEYFNSILQVSNVASPHLKLTYEQVCEGCDIKGKISGAIDDEVMPFLEVTLFPEWKKITASIIEKFSTVGKRKKIKIKNINLYSQLRLLREVTLLLGVVSFIFYLITFGNNWFKNYLVDKISVYEPKYLWVEEGLKFKPVDKEEKTDFNLTPGQLSSLAKEKIETDFTIEEFSPETDVVVTSIEQLPKDLDYADLEQSDYEEADLKGYRDTRFGKNKIFRIIMKANDTLEASENLGKLLTKYDVVQADNVKPGKEVPGGIYYNLFVPRENLADFLSQVMKVEESDLYETRITGRNPPGKNKVFIWVKSI